MSSNTQPAGSEGELHHADSLGSAGSSTTLASSVIEVEAEQDEPRLTPKLQTSQQVIYSDQGSCQEPWLTPLRAGSGLLLVLVLFSRWVFTNKHHIWISLDRLHHPKAFSWFKLVILCRMGQMWARCLNAGYDKWWVLLQDHIWPKGLFLVHWGFWTFTRAQLSKVQGPPEGWITAALISEKCCVLVWRRPSILVDVCIGDLKTLHSV